MGLTAIDYPCPAPTGIADVRLPDAPETLVLSPRLNVAQGARHRLRLTRRDVIARVQVTNLFDTCRWIADSSEGLTYSSGRYVGFSLATDLES